MNKIVHVFDGDYLTVAMFQRNGWSVLGADTEGTPDLVIFTGGSDVSPSYYNEVNVASGPDPARDAYESEIFEAYRDTPKAGICRGGQFLNVMSGGRMWQDTDRHGRYHKLRDLLTGKDHFVSSTHHQMMRPSGLAEIVAVADESTYRMAATAHNVKAVEHYQDIEVLYYPVTKSLCFQPHPEYDDAGETEKYFFELLERYFKFDEGEDIEPVYDPMTGQPKMYDLDEIINFDGAFGA
jgi:gamma-glutamyl-gamma-aminobutyrate hydrolase PuuD